MEELRWGPAMSSYRRSHFLLSNRLTYSGLIREGECNAREEEEESLGVTFSRLRECGYHVRCFRQSVLLSVLNYRQRGISASRCIYA